MHGNIIAGWTHVILRKQLSTSGGRGGFLLFKLLSGVANNLNGKNGKVKIKDILEAIDGGTISSRGETRASTVDGGRANNGSKGLNRSKCVHQLTDGDIGSGRGRSIQKGAIVVGRAAASGSQSIGREWGRKSGHQFAGGNSRGHVSRISNKTKLVVRSYLPFPLFFLQFFHNFEVLRGYPPSPWP